MKETKFISFCSFCLCRAIPIRYESWWNYCVWLTLELDSQRPKWKTGSQILHSFQKITEKKRISMNNINTNGKQSKIERSNKHEDSIEKCNLNILDHQIHSFVFLIIFFLFFFVWISTEEGFGSFHLIIFKYNSIQFLRMLLWFSLSPSLCPWTSLNIIIKKKLFRLHLISHFIRFHCSTQIAFCCYGFLSIIETSISCSIWYGRSRRTKIRLQC